MASISSVTAGGPSFPPSIQSPAPPRLPELPRPSDLALFFHTSGTTGRPKVREAAGPF